MKYWTGVLLILAGIELALPQAYSWMTALTGDQPYIQVVIGIASVVIGLWVLFGKDLIQS